MKIYGIQKTSLVDYPGKVATTLFTGGCNFRCPYCHNSELILGLDGVDAIDSKEIFEHLNKRKAMIEAVVISGGEPTLQKDLPEFIASIKEMGFQVKLDTNGTNFAMLQQLIEENLLDYVAMDIKHSRVKYPTIAVTEAYSMDDILASVELLKQGKVDYEFRTTLCLELHRDTDMTAIGMWLMGAKNYVMQPYKESEYVLQKGFHPHSKAKLEEYKALMSAFVENVEIRGLD